ncbi:MAG: hypothetical protein M3R51_06615 [Candidatus Eremiobacteraeota bacterium]|nr:hypothetical protein [Candidatus Eremiobacteraeota bacterium]
MTHKAPPPAIPAGTVAQVPPVNQQPIGAGQTSAAVGLPVGFTYTADLSIAKPYGNVGSYAGRWLPGGLDLVAAYGFNSTTRLVASEYQLQHYPVGFDSGTVPIYLRGFANPIGCANLDNTASNGCSASNINVRTKDTFGLFMLQKLFAFNVKGRALPIVVSPTYVARTSIIGQSTRHDDVVPFASSPPDGPTFFDVKTRTAQVQSLAFTVPFLKTPKMFGTFTAAPSWLVRPSGLNETNKAQIYQILYLEYTPTARTTIFFEPQSSRDYLPTDTYPQHLAAYFLGASYRTTKTTFVQVVLNSGGPTNEGSYGISSILCDNAYDAGACAPVIGGLKATQLQVQFGIGSPSVLPF